MNRYVTKFVLVHVDIQNFLSTVGALSLFKLETGYPIIALRHGFERISSGQTSYTSKCIIVCGASLTPEIFLKRILRK
jgi:hypothetical protein